MSDRDDRVRVLHRRVLVLSFKRPQREAYELAEKLEKRSHGERLYKNYGSYKSAICRRRKQEKL